MNHSMAVGADQMKVCQLGLGSGQELVNGKAVVDFDEAVTPFPVGRLEVEITRLAGQFAVSSEASCGFWFDQLP
jgi:hypothetical protein